MSQTMNLLGTDELTVTGPAQSKLSELIDQVEEPIAGVRVYATPGGCSGISFGMSFTDQITGNDGVLECEGVKVIVDGNTMQYLRGVEIDFIARDGGEPAFVFNNLQPIAGGGGCGSCGSGGCS